MEGRFQMISSNLERYKFPQLTSVLIASFSLIITIILSPRTWERSKHLLFVSGYMLIYLCHPNPHILQQMYAQTVTSAQWWNSFPAWITILFPLWCVGTKDWCLPPTALSLPGSCCFSHGLQLPLKCKCVVTLYSVISNDIKTWHLLASWTVWAQWRKNDALASTEDVSWWR